MSSPSDDTALIIPFRLPAPLEALRRRCSPDATAGLPAHATLLYPFGRPETLDEAMRATIERVVTRHTEFECRLVGLGQWPGVLFATVEPHDPFRSLYAELLGAFPEYPAYGGRFDFVPHVTVAVGPAADAPETARDAAWRTLPVTRRVTRAELIVRGPTGWDVQWSFALSKG